MDMLNLSPRLREGWVRWGNDLRNIYTGERILGISGGAVTNMRGGAHDIRDLQPNVQVNTVGQRTVADYLLTILDQYNAEWDNIRTEMLGPQTTDYVLAIEREASGMYLQPADEYSRPDAFRLGGRTTFHLPLRPYQRRTSWTRTYLARATVGDLMRLQEALALQDTNTLIRDALLALLRNDSYVFEDELYGDLTVRPFLNADGFIPPPYFGKTFDGTHTHYASTVGALVNADFSAIKAHLTEHGFWGNLVAWVDQNLEDEIRALTDFKPRPDPYMIIPPGSTTNYVTVTEPDAIGRIHDIQIVLKPFMPANYLFVWDKSQGPPLLERIHEIEEFRGFNLVTREEKFPLQDAFYERWTGFAVNNRINGYCMFVDAGANYVTPTSLAVTV